MLLLGAVTCLTVLSGAVTTAGAQTPAAAVEEPTPTAPPVAAHGVIDPHALYERSCAGCHKPHGSELAKTSLKEREGALVGARSGRPLPVILERHHGVVLTPAEVKALVDHFSAILPTGWLYQEKCLGCHERAVDLARTRLAERDGALIGRYTGRDIARFLDGHGRLDAAQAGIILSMLRRQLATAPP
jgi:predicted CXXCH cytochrome family protein